jgi:hypothetical protein
LAQTQGISDRRKEGQTPIVALANNDSGSDMNTSDARQKVFTVSIGSSF